jgi:hypothetical protein
MDFPARRSACRDICPAGCRRSFCQVCCIVAGLLDSLPWHLRLSLLQPLARRLLRPLDYRSVAGKLGAAPALLMSKIVPATGAQRLAVAARKKLISQRTIRVILQLRRRPGQSGGRAASDRQWLRHSQRLDICKHCCQTVAQCKTDRSVWSMLRVCRSSRQAHARLSDTCCRYFRSMCS